MIAFRRMRPLLGTYVEVGTLTESNAIPPDFGSYFEIIEKVHSLLSFHDAKSDLSRLNGSNGQAVELHPLSIRVLKLAKAFSRASNGAFNPTVGGSLQKIGALPIHGKLNSLDFGDETDIYIYGNTAKLLRPIQVTLDGIAKGYAVDLAINLMRKSLSNGWVNAGGDLRAFGSVELPVQRRALSGEMESLGGLKEMAIASSLVRPAFDKHFPSWILSTSQAPVHKGVWSVLSKKAWRADALTKVLCTADPSEQTAILRRLGGVAI